MRLLQTHQTTDSEFYQGDSQDLFITNCKRMPDDWVWRNKKVTYTLNQQNYRCPEWNRVEWNNSILLFGCSYILGIGIDDKDTCAYQLNLLQNNSVVNLGMCGSSPTVQWANSCILKEHQVAPAAVIYVWPDLSRTVEFLRNRIVVNHGVWTSDSWSTVWSTHETHALEHFRYLLTSTSKLWNCPVLHYSLNRDIIDNIDVVRHLGFGLDDKARDWNGYTAHPGSLTNQFWADKFSQDLNRSLAVPKFI
jgi:hypothetical protein